MFCNGAYRPGSRAADRRWLSLAAAVLLTACSPRLTVEPPQQPITINLNIKIEQEVRIHVERDLEDLFDADTNLF